MQLRGYQSELQNAIYKAWGRRPNVLAQAPTGAGKTVVMAHIVREFGGRPIGAIAHRRELVSQISLALAREKVRHRIIGPRPLVRWVNQYHVEELGRSYYDAASPVAVASVDTLIQRATELNAWARTVSLWVMDEAHHVLKDNKWGTAVAMFPNAYGLGVTATPGRADGKGLGADSHGVFHELVQGPSMRDLIALGNLVDYRIFIPPSDLDLTGVTISPTTGDFSAPQVRERVRKSHIVGDIVQHYLRIARGKLGVTFVPDVETAQDVAQQFRNAGVPAEAVSANSSDEERTSAVRRLRKGQLLQIVNVDLFGEGFDLPAIEVVSFGRPTQSLNLYIQQFGRVLRPREGKTRGLIIDHVGNVMRHGLPDRARVWSLEAREKRRSEPLEGSIPIKACPQCTAAYEAHLYACPYCGFTPAPRVRSGPQHVAGDLFELDPAVLEQMRKGADAIMAATPPELHRLKHAGANAGAIAGYEKNHRLRREAQAELRETMARWAGMKRAEGLDERQRHRMFYHLFGLDSLSAQTLGRPEAEALAAKIRAAIQ